MVHVCVGTGNLADIDDLLPVVVVGAWYHATIYFLSLKAPSETLIFPCLLVAFEWISQNCLSFKSSQWRHHITVGQPKQGVSQNSGFRESKVSESGLD